MELRYSFFIKVYKAFLEGKGGVQLSLVLELPGHMRFMGGRRCHEKYPTDNYMDTTWCFMGLFHWKENIYFIDINYKPFYVVMDNVRPRISIAGDIEAYETIFSDSFDDVSLQ